MAIVVLLLWLFTAGAGFSLLVTGNLGRSRPAPSPAQETVPAHAPAVASVAAAPGVPGATAPAPGVPGATAAAPGTAEAGVTAAADAPKPATAAPPSKRELRRAARHRFDPPSLTASRNAPIVPGLRPLLEFAHPALAIIGLGFWLGFTLVHNHLLGWIAFGLVAATACLGLTWFATNTRAARAPAAKSRDQGGTAPAFGIRLVVLHGSGAAVTLVLAALSALVLSR